jgi:hypothetical protein
MGWFLLLHWSYMPSSSPPVPQPVDLAAESVAGEDDPGAALDIPPAAAGDACPTCGGVGQLSGGPCPDCDGTGKLVPGR